MRRRLILAVCSTVLALVPLSVATASDSAGKPSITTGPYHITDPLHG